MSDEQIEVQIAQAVHNLVPNNPALVSLIIAQARHETTSNYRRAKDDYKPYTSRVFLEMNNLFGHKVSPRILNLGGSVGDRSPEGDSYAKYPNIATCIKAHLDLYRDGGKYSGILAATTPKQFTDKLANTYAPGYAHEYADSIRTKFSKVEMLAYLKPYTGEKKK